MRSGIFSGVLPSLSSLLLNGCDTFESLWETLGGSKDRFEQSPSNWRSPTHQLCLHSIVSSLHPPFGKKKTLMSSTQPPATRTHCVSSRSLLITFQKREIRDAFVSTLFNQGPTWLKRATPNLTCVIYVLPQQIASQGNQLFHFLGYNSGGKRDPSCFNIKLISAFTPPLWNIKAVVEGEHVDALSYLRWNMKVRWYDPRPPFVTWL